MERDELIYLVALNSILMYNGKAARELIEVCGDAAGVFRLNAGDLIEVFGKKYSFFGELLNKQRLQEAEEEVKWAEQTGVDIICFTGNDKQYPKRLLDCADPPLLIYKKGYGTVDANRVVSIVGTRRATPYGISCTKRIVRELAETGVKPSIVSGFAYGIDITAHISAMEHNLNTIAVMGTGLDEIYPASHRKYANRIMQRGAVISEFPKYSCGRKINFLRRNRIIAGISDATIVVESGERGGSIITAKLAQSYSRDVYAVPGSLNDSLSCGCNMLISQNTASLYFSTISFAEQMGWSSFIGCKQQQNNKQAEGGSLQKEKILLALKRNPGLNIDQLQFFTGLNIPEISRSLLELELEERIESCSGRRFYTI